MRKKLTDKTVFMVVAVLCIALFLVFYNVVLAKINDSISMIESENNAIINHLAQLQEYYETKEQNLENIQIMSKEATNILAKFPSDVRNEDMIMQGVTIYQAVNKDGGLYMLYNGIDMGETEEVYLVSQEIIDGAQVEGYTRPIGFEERPVVYSTELGYFTLKDAVKVLLSSSYALNLESISFKVDEETGNLNGSIKVGFFYVNGVDKEYVAPKTESYELSSEEYMNLFVNGHNKLGMEEEE